MSPEIRGILTVTLNPTCDRVLEVAGLEIGQHARGRLVSRSPAGKAINVSRTLAALGVPSTAVGWVGRETLEAFEKAATDDGFTPHFTAIAGSSRENITIIDSVRKTETHIREEGPQVTASDITRLLTELTALSSPGTLLIFTGSLPPGLSPQRFGDMLDACLGRGALVAVDTSGEALREAARRRLLLLKPNTAELAELAGRELKNEIAIMGAARELQRNTPLVIVSMGEDGLMCLAEEGTWRGRLTLPPERVRSTVGCGDALLGAVVAGLAANLQIEEALRRALAVAAASATNPRPASFTLEQVRELLPFAELQQVT